MLLAQLAQMDTASDEIKLLDFGNHFHDAIKIVLDKCKLQTPLKFSYLIQKTWVGTNFMILCKDPATTKLLLEELLSAIG